MTMKCAYSSDEVPRAQRIAGTWLGIACELVELVDVKRKQIICNPRCEREIKLMRLKLKRNSQYFAISNQLAKQEPLVVRPLIIRTPDCKNP